MTASETVLAIILFVIAALFALLAARQFAEKGFLFNNAYIWASKKQRESMDKRPYYRQSAIVCCLLCTVFLVIALSVVLQNSTIQLLEIPLLLGALIYAIVSTIVIEKRKRG